MKEKEKKFSISGGMNSNMVCCSSFDIIGIPTGDLIKRVYESQTERHVVVLRLPLRWIDETENYVKD